MSDESKPEKTSDENYLKRELYELVQTSSEIFEFLQSGSLDGIWYWDMTQPEEEWLSPRFKEVFGYEDHEIPNTSAWWQENIFPEDLEAVMERAQAHLEDPNVPYDQVVRYRHKDGSTVWIRCRGKAIRDENGKPIRMLGAHTDLTAQKEAELALERQIEKIESLNAELEEAIHELAAVNLELSHANEELESFAYAASHDLREPLRMMSSFSALLEARHADALDDEAKKYLGFITEGAERMQSLIDDILHVARVGSSSVKLEEVKLARVAKLVLDDLQPLVEEHDAEVVIEELPTVEVDRFKFRRVVQNLVTNSIKHRRPDVAPKVTIASSIEEDHFRISFEDNGKGIRPEDHERIFQMFQRLSAHNKQSGNGIGLAVVKNIVGLHRGTIEVESELGVGTTIHILLPREQHERDDVETISTIG